MPIPSLTWFHLPIILTLTDSTHQASFPSISIYCLSSSTQSRCRAQSEMLMIPLSQGFCCCLPYGYCFQLPDLLSHVCHSSATQHTRGYSFGVDGTSSPKDSVIVTSTNVVSWRDAFAIVRLLRGNQIIFLLLFFVHPKQPMRKLQLSVIGQWCCYQVPYYFEFLPSVIQSVSALIH